LYLKSINYVVASNVPGESKRHRNDVIVIDGTQNPALSHVDLLETFLMLFLKP